MLPNESELEPANTVSSKAGHPGGMGAAVAEPETPQGDVNGTSAARDPGATAANARAAPASTKGSVNDHTNVGGRPQAVFTNWCKGCGICIAFCPRGVLAAGEDGVPMVVVPDRCTGCRMCEVRCPDFAIRAPGGRKREDRNG